MGGWIDGPLGRDLFLSALLDRLVVIVCAVQGPVVIFSHVYLSLHVC